jgi:hypothetical protein
VTLRDAFEKKFGPQCWLNEDTEWEKYREAFGGNDSEAQRDKAPAKDSGAQTSGATDAGAEKPLGATADDDVF